MSTERFRLGLDLDLTLVDTRRATEYALAQVNHVMSSEIEIDRFIERLGPPIRSELAKWLDVGEIDQAVSVFRTAFTSGEGLARLEPAPGARELLSWIRAHGHEAVIITSRLSSIAETISHSVGLLPMTVYGGLTGTEKAAAMVQEGLVAYVGDHPLDMEGAVAAGVTGIGIASGNHSTADLHDAGGLLTLVSLSALVAWLDSRSSPATELRRLRVHG